MKHNFMTIRFHKLTKTVNLYQIILLTTLLFFMLQAASCGLKTVPVLKEETTMDTSQTDASSGNISIQEESTIYMGEATLHPEEDTSQSEEDLFSNLQIEYADGFYFQPISPEIEKRITGISYPAGCAVPLSDLKYVRVKYYNFQNQVESGELIVHHSIAMDILEIFKELFDARYPIEKIRLIDTYGGNDEASMADNNSSAFNYRFVDGTTTLSDHSFGLAIDINPLYNPYVRTGFGERNILPVNAAAYANRDADFPYKIQKGDICYNAFTSRGFLWGGDWEGTKDYQHFYISAIQ